MKLRQVLRKEWSRWLKFMRKDFLTIFTIYAAINITMVLIYMLSQQVVQTDLELKPQLTPEAEGSFFPIALLLLPFTLLLEDLGMRLLPWTAWLLLKLVMKLIMNLLKPLPTLSRIFSKIFFLQHPWFYRNEIKGYIVVSALWHSSLHQSNVFTANFLGIIAYFTVQLVAGSLLAWISIKKGFWQSYTIHVSWDLLIIGIMILSSLLSSL